MATKGTIERFNERYHTWKTRMDLQKVIRSEFGDFSLKDLKEPLEKFDNFLAEVDQFKSEIPESILSQAHTQLDDIMGWCSRAITANQQEFINSRDGFRTELETRLDKFELLRLSLLPLMQQKIIGKTDEYLNQGRASAEKLEEIRISEEKEFADLKNRFKDVYSSTTIAVEKQKFEFTATANINRANKWLIGIVISSLSLGVWLWFIAYNFCFDLSCYQIDSLTPFNAVCYSCAADVLYFEIVKSIMFRLFIITFLVFLVTLCVRNYNSNMHNYTVNDHKANSLDAALYLLSKASPQASDLIINQASSAIFSHQPTGYSRKDPENIGQPFIDRLSDLLKKSQ